MSGLVVGTRVDQLVELRRRIDWEIQRERRAASLGTAAPRPGRVFRAPAPRAIVPPARVGPVSTTLVVVDVSAVSSPVVRDWAIAQGHSVGRSGPLGPDVVAAFVTAHAPRQGGGDTGDSRGA